MSWERTGIKRIGPPSIFLALLLLLLLIEAQRFPTRELNTDGFCEDGKKPEISGFKVPRMRCVYDPTYSRDDE
ncbi:MAG: hypothetical protein AAGC77_04380 [Pseudomonadota bacterium]